MAGDAYGFDERGVRRIIATVRARERAPQQLPRHNSAPGPSATDRCWLVRVAGSGSTGDPQTPDGNNLIPGTVLHVDPLASTSSGSCFETGGNCKILVASPIGAAPALNKGDQYLARFSGLLASGDPLLVVDPPGIASQRLILIYGDNVGPLGSGTGRIYTGTPGSETYSGTTLTFWNKGIGVLRQNMYGMVESANGTWYWSGPGDGFNFSGVVNNGGDISSGGSGTVDLKTRSGSAITVASIQVSVTATSDLGGPVTDGTKVHVTCDGIEWAISSGECET